MKEIANLISHNDVKVNIVAVDFFHELNDEDEEQDSSIIKETENQKLTKKYLKELMERTDNVKVFTSKMASLINKQFKKKKINPVTKYRGPLIVTPELYIDICVYTKTSKVNIPSLKKYSTATDFSMIYILI